MKAMEFLMILTGYVGVTVVSLFALVVLWQIVIGRIDLAKLISEKDGSASMSRFQFLIFTFVIGFGLVLLIIIQAKANTAAFPAINSGVMALLGISGGTYAVSKGIQKSNENKSETKDGATTGGSTGESSGWPRT